MEWFPLLLRWNRTENPARFPDLCGGDSVKLTSAVESGPRFASVRSCTRPRCSASTNNNATTEKKTASLILTCRSCSSLLGTELGTECGRRLSPFVFLEGEDCTQARNTENLGLPDITISCHARALRRCRRRFVRVLCFPSPARRSNSPTNSNKRLT